MEQRDGGRDEGKQEGRSQGSKEGEKRIKKSGAGKMTAHSTSKEAHSLQ